MKKFMKGCAITAFIFAVLGCVLGMIGSSMAGRATISQVVEAATGGRVHMDPERWWSMRMEIGEEILDELGLIDDIGHHGSHTEVGDSGHTDHGSGAGSGGYDIGGAGMFDADEDTYFNGDVEKYCPGSNIRDLDIEVGGCSLETRASDDGYIYLEMEKAYKFQGYVEDGTLYVRAVTGSANTWSELGGRRIILYLPDGYRFQEADVELGAGAMEFDGLNAGEISLEVGAGKIVLHSPRAEELEISVGAGSIEITDMEVTRLDVEVGMGEFLADGVINGDASVECAMGNIEMSLAGSERDFNYYLEGAMGNLEVGSASFSGFSREQEIDNHAARDMEVECSMGNVTIRFEN